MGGVVSGDGANIPYLQATAPGSGAAKSSAFAGGQQCFLFGSGVAGLFMGVSLNLQVLLNAGNQGFYRGCDQQLTFFSAGSGCGC